MQFMRLSSFNTRSVNNNCFSSVSLQHAQRISTRTRPQARTQQHTPIKRDFCTKTKKKEHRAPFHKLYSCGSAEDGALGVDTQMTSLVRPRLVESLTRQVKWSNSPSRDFRFIDVAAGWAKSFAVTDKHEVFSWGKNDGQARVQHPTLSLPVLCDHLSNMGVVSVAVGRAHCLLLTKSQDVFAIGNNDFGQLGIGSKKMRELRSTSPVQTATRTPERITPVVEEDFANNVNTSSHTSDDLPPRFQTAPLKSPKLGFGDLGKNVTMSPQQKKSLEELIAKQFEENADKDSVLVPHRLDKLCNKGIVQIESGLDHACALSEDGTVYTWGWNPDGQLGTGNLEWYSEPVEISFPEFRIARIACGNEVTALLTESGQILVAGNNEGGQLGLGVKHRRVPNFTTVTGPLENKFVASIALGGLHMLALTEDQEVYAWGMGHDGALGIDLDSYRAQPDEPEEHDQSIPEGIELPNLKKFIQSTPVHVKELSGKGVVRVAAGGGASFALTEDGKVYSWGFGENGALGHGVDASQEIPRWVEAFRGRNVVNIAAGVEHTLFVVEDTVDD